ncbi:MAG: hypothetical protein E2O76_09080 [Caldithrix sp.]|nr:MAG: hypothetical protein E2O76_09080 [Caldithrix sp.]
MNIGEILTSWTIWIALAAYFAGLAGLLLSRLQPNLQTVTRWVWTVGCVFYLGHVISAFQFYHEWSHQAAVFETARQTKEVVGEAVGSGIYMTYLFTLLWVLDAGWWWLNGNTGYFRRSKKISLSIHFFLFFIVFNGTIVFEGGLLRLLSALAIIGLVVVWGYTYKYRNAFHPAARSSFT